MRRLALPVLAIVSMTWLLATPRATRSIQAPAPSEDRWSAIHATIRKYLGRPYVWGAVGEKSFDCSGFVWRVMSENGIALKRTTARKLYVCLPAASGKNTYDPGCLVFFDGMKHVGIVNDHESFYHAQTGKGTNLSEFAPYWRPRICGFRKVPMRERSGGKPDHVLTRATIPTP